MSVWNKYGVNSRCALSSLRSGFVVFVGFEVVLLVDDLVGEPLVLVG